jgi:hypothetical protein
MQQNYERKMAVFWVLAMCRLVEVYRPFKGAYCLYHQGDETTLCNIPGNSHLHTRRRENLKSQK